MELNFKQYHFNIKRENINCIMGSGIKLEELIDACKYVDSVELIIQPVINQTLYKNVEKELTYAFEQSNHHNSTKILDSLKLVGLPSSYINKNIRKS